MLCSCGEVTVRLEASQYSGSALSIFFNCSGVSFMLGGGVGRRHFLEGFGKFCDSGPPIVGFLGGNNGIGLPRGGGGRKGCC